jgi:hypothetical protein
VGWGGVGRQFAKVLPKNMEARKAFVTSGGLKRIQEIEAEPGSKLREYIDQVALGGPILYCIYI